jgi:predicted nucleotidyltransferase
MSLFEELIEDKEVDKEIIKSFGSKDSLPDTIFSKENNNFKLKDEIRKKLLEITNEFLEFIGIDFFVFDIVLTGSLANYNWSKYSDVDIHILIDFDEFSSGKVSSKVYMTIVKEFFDLKRRLWNSTTDISIKNYEVELYVQDVDDKHLSSGVYSILNSEWIIEPQKSNPKIDDRKILEKGEEYAKLIDDLSEKSEQSNDITKDLNELKLKIKKFRQSGLESGGEYSYENLTFKLLRRNGYIQKLMNIKTSIRNKKLSLTQ